MRMKTLSLGLTGFVLSAAVLGGCGASSGSAEPAGSDGGRQNSSSEEEPPAVKIVDFGFGQGQFATEAMVIVTTDSEAAIGESVTVTVNFLDDAGQILSTTDQVESFNWVGQELALPVYPTDLAEGAKVASIEPSVAISDYGMAGDPKSPLPVLESSEVTRAEFGGFTSSFGFTNETSSDLRDLRVGVVCYDAEDKIIGGTSTHPSLAPAGKTIRITAEPTVSAKPAACKAFVNYDVL